MAGFKAPPVARSRFPQLMIDSCRWPWASITNSVWFIERWKRSVSLTKSPPARWHDCPEIGAMKCALWPFLLCAEIIGILVTSHAAGDVPLPWHMPLCSHRVLLVFLVSPCKSLRVTIPCSEEEFHSLDCRQLQSNCRCWHAKGLEYH